MKKFVSIALALVLCFAMVAFAAPSNEANNVTATVDESIVAVAAAAENTVAAAAANDLVAALSTEGGDVATALQFDTAQAAQLEGIVGPNAVVNDIAPLAMDVKAAVETPVSMTFDTVYPAGQKVAILLTIVNPDGTLSTIILEGVGNGQGVDFTIPADAMASILAAGGQCVVTTMTAAPAA